MKETGTANIQFASNTYNINEDGSYIDIEVNRTGDNSDEAGALFNFGGTAEWGIDYTSTDLSDGVHFPPGDSSPKHLRVNIINDGLLQGNLFLDASFRYGGYTNGFGTPNSTTINILEDDYQAQAVSESAPFIETFSGALPSVTDGWRFTPYEHGTIDIVSGALRLDGDGSAQSGLDPSPWLRVATLYLDMTGALRNAMLSFRHRHHGDYPRDLPNDFIGTPIGDGSISLTVMIQNLLGRT